MNLSNLPPVGTPEYWRAIRQLTMRAKVDIDRLWGRVLTSHQSQSMPPGGGHFIAPPPLPSVAQSKEYAFADSLGGDCSCWSLQTSATSLTVTLPTDFDLPDHPISAMPAGDYSVSGGLEGVYVETDYCGSGPSSFFGKRYTTSVTFPGGSFGKEIILVVYRNCNIIGYIRRFWLGGPFGGPNQRIYYATCRARCRGEPIVLDRMTPQPDGYNAPDYILVTI